MIIKTKVFAYGSNMWSARMFDRVGSARTWGLAKIDDMIIEFNKVGSVDGTGKANIVNRKNQTVYGVIYEMDPDDLLTLDSIEKGYQRNQLKFTDIEGNYLHAFTYISSLTDSSLRPTPEYKDFVVGGALEHRLPICYINRLSQIQPNS